MKAIELHLGSSLYVAYPDEIIEYSVDALNVKDGKIYVQSGYTCYGGVELIMNPDDTEGKKRNSEKVVYLNLDDAEIAQLLERDKAVKNAYRYMIQHQETYYELVSKYMFAKPSKPIKK